MVTAVTQMASVTLGAVPGIAPRSRLMTDRMPLVVPRSRTPMIIRSVAMPSGSGGKQVRAAAGSGGLKQLISPFSDPQANSKMLSLASGTFYVCLWAGGVHIATTTILFLYSYIHTYIHAR